MKTNRCLVLALLMASPVAFAQIHTGLGAATGVAGGIASPPAQAQVGAGATGAGTLDVNRPMAGNAGAEVNGNAAAQGHDLNAGSNGAVDVTTALNPSDTVRDINATAFDARKSLTDEVSDRIDTGRKTISSLRSISKSLDADARAKFDAALDEARARETALKHSLKAARKATTDTWSSAQAALASDYQAYATAVAQLDATVQK
jgi:hypothetical protein